MSKQHTCPFIVDGDPKNQKIQKLEKLHLGLSRDCDEKSYDEDWIQNLIHNNPSILPVEELESAFFPLYTDFRAGFTGRRFVLFSQIDNLVSLMFMNLFTRLEQI
jgi:hypothetical protein